MEFISYNIVTQYSHLPASTLVNYCRVINMVRYICNKSNIFEIIYIFVNNILTIFITRLPPQPPRWVDCGTFFI